jgi:hypothetical protein
VGGKCTGTPRGRAPPADSLVVSHLPLLGVVLIASLAASPARADLHRIGVLIDAGLPDGATGALVYRPAAWLRLHAGAGTNLISPGVRVGVSVLPLRFLSLNLDAGHFFPGDANPLFRALSGDATVEVAALREVGYDHASLHLGLELGGRRATFFVHGGVSHIRGTVRGLAETLAAAAGPEVMVTLAEDPKVRIWTVSGRAGVLFYFL